MLPVLYLRRIGSTGYLLHASFVNLLGVLEAEQGELLDATSEIEAIRQRLRQRHSQCMSRVCRITPRAGWDHGLTALFEDSPES
jgi:hypothetical protein